MLVTYTETLKKNHFEVDCFKKRKNKKYLAIGTVSKSNRKSWNRYTYTWPLTFLAWYGHLKKVAGLN